MSDPRVALSRIQFAFAYDAEHFDPQPIAQYLEKRDSFGGLSTDELGAGLALRLNKNDPVAIVDFISKHRSQFETGFDKGALVAIEVQALAMAGDAASAKFLLSNNTSILPADALVQLEAEVARAEGADPLSEYKKVYETTGSADALRVLVGVLLQKHDHLAAGLYAEKLFGLTSDPHDIMIAAKSYANAGEDDHFIRIVQQFPFVRGDDPAIAERYAWRLLAAAV